MVRRRRILLHNRTKYKSRYTSVQTFPYREFNCSTRLMKPRFIFRMEMNRNEIRIHGKYLNWNDQVNRMARLNRLQSHFEEVVWFFSLLLSWGFSRSCQFRKITHLRTHHLFGCRVCAVCAHTLELTDERTDGQTHTQASCVFSFWQFMVSIQLIVCVHTYQVMFTICVQVNERIRSRKIATTRKHT